MRKTIRAQKTVWMEFFRGKALALQTLKQITTLITDCENILNVLINWWTVVCTEMVDFMKRVAGLDVELTVEERNLLSVAYKNVIGARRASWRIISSIEQKEDKGASAKTEQIVEYRKMVRLLIWPKHHTSLVFNVLKWYIYIVYISDTFLTFSSVL